MRTAVFITLALALAGCEGAAVTTFDTEARQRTSYLLMNPLCILICSGALTTTGSKTDVRGNGSSGTSTQSPAVSTGASNG